MRRLEDHGPTVAFVAKAYIAEVAKLARKAERYGAPPQASRLMSFAELIDLGHYDMAACIRDLIKIDLDDAVHRRRAARLEILGDLIEAILEFSSDACRRLGTALLFVLMCLPVALVFGGIGWLAYAMAHP